MTILCFCGYIPSSPSCSLLTASLRAVLSSVLTVLRGDIFRWALTDFVFNALACKAFCRGRLQPGSSRLVFWAGYIRQRQSQVHSIVLIATVFTAGDCWRCRSSVCWRLTAALLSLILMVLGITVVLAGLFNAVLFWSLQWSKLMFRVQMIIAMFFTALHGEIIWLSFRHTLSNRHRVDWSSPVQAKLVWFYCNDENSYGNCCSVGKAFVCWRRCYATDVAPQASGMFDINHAMTSWSSASLLFVRHLVFFVADVLQLVVASWLLLLRVGKRLGL